jgi:hypothetical protein
MLLMHPVFDVEDRHPLKYETIRDYQAQDEEALNQRVVDTPQKYSVKLLTGDVQIICYTPRPEEPNKWQIAVPEYMLEPLVTWYHVALSHVGMTRLEQMIKLHFYHSIS